MNNKNGEDFKKQAKIKTITKWNSHECSMCGYMVGYHFNEGHVFYDSGCDCTLGVNLNPRTWEDVANTYNRQTHPEAINKMNEFWGFKC